MIRIEDELIEAERKAWSSLARYKFWMFGYYAARWVYLNRIGDFGRPNPFSGLISIAKEKNSPPEQRGVK